MALQHVTLFSSSARAPLIKLGAKGKPLILIAGLLILCILSIIFVRDNDGSITTPTQVVDYQPSVPMSNELWQYLRAGLNYLEASGKNYPPSFVHPGGVAYGPLALTRIAVLDVIQNRETLSELTPEDVFTKPLVYEEFAKNYADLLLRHYLGMSYYSMSAEEAFDVLQRAWFLGPSLYKAGGKILLSREKKAQEYILEISTSFHQPSPQQEEIF